jgi:hypothetical protein
MQRGFAIKFLWFILFLNYLSYGELFSQDLHFTHYSVDKGLPSSQVHDIIQDNYGKLWFSTDQGLASYDGYSFKHYTTANGLTDNVVFKFYRHSSGKIWCTTFNKTVFSISGSKPVFEPYPFNKILSQIPDPFISNCIHVSKKGELFMSMVNALGYIHIDSSGKIERNSIGTISAELCRIFLLAEKNEPDFFFMRSNQTIKRLTGNWSAIKFSNQNNKASDYIKACFFERTKHAVFTNSRNITIYSEANDSIRMPVSFEPISLGKLNDKLFWVGFRYGGVGIFDLKGHQLSSFLPGKSVTSLFVDHEGGYWFSTLNDGVFHTKTAAVWVYKSDELKDDWINSLAKDENENLWIGYYNGNVSLLSAMKITEKYKSKLKKPALTVFDSHSNNMYFMSDHVLFKEDAEHPLFDMGTNLINYYVHKNDSVLFASYKAIVIRKGRIKSNFTTGWRVNDICYYNNDFYLGSNKGFYKIQNQKLQLVKLHENFRNVSVSDLEEHHGNLVIGTKGNGVWFLTANGVYQKNEKDGLSSNMINSVYCENDTVVWACTNRGLNRITPGRVDLVSVQTGLISNEITDVEIIRDTVWVGTRQGLCYFPKSLLNKKFKEINYYLRINELKVNDSVCLLPSSKALNYYENRIEFSFEAVSFSELSPFKYRYKLYGLETNWNYSESRSVVYPSLPAGTYTFLVQAKGGNASWENGEQKFSFTIHPPWWKTWWFTASAILSGIILTYLFFRFRILSYNRDITRELLRQLLKRLTKKTPYIVVKEQGKEIRIASHSICFVKASGNYIDIQTDMKKYVVRQKIGEFLKLVPDPLEYLRINRSCIVRLDKIQEKSKKDITVRGEKIAVGETYTDQLQKIKL